MRKMLILALCALLGLSMAGCSIGGAANKLEAIQKANKLVVYTDPNFPPFEYIGEGGQPEGVDIDIARAIADALEVEVEFKEAEFDTILMGLKNGKADIAISGFTITEERKENVDFSDPYIKSVQYLILPQGSSIATMEDLAGKIVGVAQGYTGQFLMEDETSKTEATEDSEAYVGVLYEKDTVIREYKSAMEGTQDIRNGRIDAMVMDEYVAKNIVSKNSDMKAIELKYETGALAEEEYGVVIPKNNPELAKAINTVVKDLKSSGSIEQWVVYHAEVYQAE